MKSKLLQLGVVWSAGAAIVLSGCSRASREARHLANGDRYFAAKQYDKAEIEYLNYHKSNATNLTVLSRLGAIYFSKGDLPKAYYFTTNAVGLDSQGLELRTRLGSIFLIGQDRPKAREQAVFVLTKNPLSEPAILLLADSSVSPEEIATAQKQFASLPAEATNKAVFHAASGKLLALEKKLEAAEAAFKRAQALDPRTTIALVGLASVYWQQGKLAEADKYFQAAAEIAPPQSTERLKWAEFNRKTGKRVEARKILEEATVKAPRFSVAWFDLAEMAFEERRLDDCRGLLSKALALNAGSVDARILDGKLKIAQGDTAGGMNELNRLASLYPSIPKLHYERAAAYLQNQEVTKAEGSLREVLKLDPNHAEAILLQATLDVRSGNHAGAITSLQRLLRNQPELLGAYYLLGSALIARGTVEDALPVYSTLEKLAPKDAQVPYLTGIAYERLKRPVEARKAFEKVLALNPTNALGILQLIELDTKEKKFPQALARVDQLISFHATSPEPLVVKARVLRAQGNVGDAEKFLLKAIEMDAEHRPAYLELADIATKSQRFDQALATVDALLKKKPKDTAALLLGALLKEKNGDLKGAIQWYEELVASNPTSHVALNNLAWLYGDRLKNWNKAREFSQKAYDLRKDDPSTADTLGWSLFQNGDYTSALPLIQQASTRLARNPEVAFHLGSVLYMAGQESAALAALRTALADAGDSPWKQEAQWRFSVLQMNPERLDQAQVEALRKSLESAPKDTMALFRLGAFYEGTRSVGQAISSYEKVLSLHPRFDPAVYRLGRLHMAAGDGAKAYQLAKAAHDLAPNDNQITSLLGSAALRQKDYLTASGLLRTATTVAPGEGGIQFDLALALFHTGQINESAQALGRAFQINSGFDAKSALKFQEMVQAYGNVDKLVPQEARINELLKEDAAYLPAWILKAMLLEHRAQFKAAAAEYEQILKSYPTFSPAVVKAALVYSEKLGDDKSALTHALKAREVARDDPRIARVLGKSYAAAGDWPSAVRNLRQAVQSGPDDAELYLLLGKAEANAKEYPRSKASLEKAITLKPASHVEKEARELLAKLPK